MKRVLLAAVLVGLASTAHAASINFDTHASTGLTSGVPPSSALVTDDYASLGIVFGRAGVSAGVAVVNNSSTNSTPNGACGLDAAGAIVSICTGDQFFYFVDPGNSLIPASTNSLSFVVGDSGGDLDSWILHIYDSSDAELEARVVASVANTLQSFSYSDIARVWIEWTDGPGGYLLDDINFATPVAAAVPEPGTLTLLVTGAGYFARRLRRRRAA
jgi:hypothetical protein